MIANLNADNPTLLTTFERLTTLYLKQYGGGNLRIASDPNRLRDTIGAAVQDGIAQSTVDGWKQYFWSGDLWVISDVAGAIAWEAPSYNFYIGRNTMRGSPSEDVSTDAELEGNLSTY